MERMRLDRDSKVTKWCTLDEIFADRDEFVTKRTLGETRAMSVA
jgi:hypothetical protein